MLVCKGGFRLQQCVEKILLVCMISGVRDGSVEDVLFVCRRGKQSRNKDDDSCRFWGVCGLEDDAVVESIVVHHSGLACLHRAIDALDQVSSQNVHL